MASIRKLAMAAFLPLALLTPSAHAETNVAVVAGLGSISPGLPTEGCAFQHVTFSGTAVDGGSQAGVYNVAFDGNSTICETLQAGEGTGTLNGDVSGTVNYVRQGSLVTISGQGSVNGHSGSIVEGRCQFYPSRANPVTAYALTCEVVLDVS